MDVFCFTYPNMTYCPHLLLFTKILIVNPLGIKQNRGLSAFSRREGADEENKRDKVVLFA